MRIGLPAGGSTAEQMIQQAERAEIDGFSTLWFPSAFAGDPLTAMALVGRATSTIELGTSVLVTYACHPALQANRVAATVTAMGWPGRFTLGIGPSHQPVIEGMLGLSYGSPGRHTDEYVQIVSQLLRGEAVSFHGAEFNVNAGAPQLLDGATVPVLVGALAPRLLRVAGQHADGTILWMGNARSIETHVAPLLTKAAADAGRPAPRIVAGLPVAVHDNIEEAREVAATQFAMYGMLPNYQRILAHGGCDGPADAAIVGNEASVTAQIQALFDAGATDVWAAPFPVGGDRSRSRARTRDLLKHLANS
jgi:F420-dependent oxidoreductase-like protein